MASKRTRVSTTTENTDRISDLPDDVLCHILSFLSTKNSVCTRVFSTRWKHLFSLVPVLDFYYGSSFRDDRTIRFLKFASWVFNSYNAGRMDTLRFVALGKLPRTCRLPSWISKSVCRGVRKLELRAPIGIPQTLPRDVFTCKTLSVLSIHGKFTLDVPENVCLPCVKTISLVHIYFIDACSARRLFQCCPVLEELYINYRHPAYIQVIDISVTSLKILTIILGYGEKFDFVLDVPNVENFVYIGEGMTKGTYSVQGLTSLAKARIENVHYHEGCKALERLFKAVCHIQDLSLCGFMFKAFQRSGRSLPMFFNLTHLEIKNISWSYSKLLLELLERTPHLQVLVIDNVGFSPRVCHENGHFSPERVPTCLSLHLKKVELKRLKLENEFKMVEYFLHNAKILDMLKIHVKGSLCSWDKHFEMRNKLLSLSKYSRACQIVLISDMGET